MIHFTDFAIANLGLVGSTRGYLGAIQGQINLGDEIEPEYTVPWFWMDGDMGETLSAAVSVLSGHSLRGPDGGSELYCLPIKEGK